MKEKGNALFLILIAVALFAALSYAVTQSGRGGGSTDREEAEMTAAQVAQFFGQVEQAFAKLRLYGCAENQLTIENNVFRGGIAGPFTADPMIPVGTNPNSPADGSCHIFDPNGGGVTPYVIAGTDDGTYAAPPGNSSHSVWWGWAYPGNPFFTSQIVPGVGTAAPDIVASMLYVPEEVCKAFARAFDRPIVAHSAMGDWTDHQFTDGTYTNSFGSWNGGGNGVTEWCMDGEDSGDRSGGTWHIYYVVYAR